MSLNKNTKPVQINIFEPASDMKWLRCVECGRAINVFDTAKLDPLTFGGATNSPETQPYSCEITCRCKATKVKAYGKMQSFVIGPKSCLGVAVSTERVFDKPCFCLEQKGSEPGHIHASLPAALQPEPAQEERQP